MYSQWPQSSEARNDAKACKLPDEHAPTAVRTTIALATEFEEVPAPTLGRRATTDHQTRLMTLEEFAEFLTVSPRWIYDNHEQLGIPALRIGRTLRFRSSDIESWLGTRATRAVPATASTPRTRT